MLRFTLCLLFLTASVCLADSQDQPTTDENPIAKLLELSGWTEEKLAALQLQPELDRESQLDLARLAKRLKRLPKQALTASTTPQSNAELPSVGSLVRLRGKVTAVEQVKLSPEEQARLEQPAYYVCVIELNAGTKAKVLTLEVPSLWLTANELRQPVSCEGIFIQQPLEPSDSSASPWVVAPAIRWLPTKVDPPLVNFGQAVLGGMGYDVSLLDKFADGKPLTRDESVPFYTTLAAMRETSPGQLIRAARGNRLPYAKRWAAELKDKTSPRRRLAAAVLLQADKGQYAVAPLFNDADEQQGQLFNFVGTCRRAVRIDLSLDRTGKPSRTPEVFGIDHYYELELFTEDSQNLPLVFCVLDLPAGFPTGEGLRERVNIAGFFLKRWAYRTRQADADNEREVDTRRLAPLLIGAGPLWIPEEDAGASETQQLIAGGAFVAVLGLIAAALWWQNRRDREFEQTTLARMQAIDSGEKIEIDVPEE